MDPTFTDILFKAVATSIPSMNGNPSVWQTVVTPTGHNLLVNRGRLRMGYPILDSYADTIVVCDEFSPEVIFWGAFSETVYFMQSYQPEEV
jgi:hypothetical protein